MSDINYSYTNLTPFKWYVLENFPFIEADFDALTNWQLFCKLGKEINKIIPAVNKVGQQTENLTTFVTNYFNNLEVQEEINNKLDQMVQDGTLAQIINEQIFEDLNIKVNSKISTVDTVNDLLAHVGFNNEVIRTKGYYTIGDGGDALYRITNDTNVTANNLDIILLNNGDKAIQIYNDKLNVKTCGAKANDTTFDNGTIFQNIINYCILKGKTMFIPQGAFTVNTPLTINNRITIEGVNQPQMWGGNAYDSRIICTKLTNNPLFTIVSTGNAYEWDYAPNRLVAGVNMKNIRIIGYDSATKDRSLTCIYGATYLSNFENIHISGFYNGVAMAGSYETIFKSCLIMACYQGFVAFVTNNTLQLYDCWINYGSNVKPGQQITNQTYITNYSKVTDYKYACIFANRSKMYCYNLAIEACVNGIYNNDSQIECYQLNIESITDFCIYVIANLTEPIMSAKKVNFYNPTNFTCTFIRVGYGCYADIGFYRKFPTVGFNSTPYIIADGGIGRIYSDIEGERIVDVPMISGATNPTIINKSHYTKTGFKVDVEVTNYDNWDGSTATQFKIPKCYQNFNVYQVQPTKGANVINTVFNNSGYLNKSDNSWFSFSSSEPKVNPRIIAEYDIKNW